MEGSETDIDEVEEFLLPLKEVCTVVLLGKTGNGKSSTGNSLLSKRAFKSTTNSGGGTATCELQTAVLDNGRILNIIDTPGLFDSSGGDERAAEKEFMKCIDLANGCITAIVLVLSTRSRFSREEEAAFLSLLEIFGDNITDYMILLFTGGDDLDEDGQSLDDYLAHDCPEPLKEMLAKCGNRCVLFDNKTKDVQKKRKQVEKFFVFVDDILWKNEGKQYTVEMFVEQKERMKVRNEAAAYANSLKEKEQLGIKLYEEKIKRITTNMNEEVLMLKLQVAEEQAARLKAENAVAVTELRRACRKLDERNRCLVL